MTSKTALHYTEFRSNRTQKTTDYNLANDKLVNKRLFNATETKKEDIQQKKLTGMH